VAALAPLANCRVAQTVRVRAVRLAVVVVVLAIETLPAGLGAVRTRARVTHAIGVLAVGLAIVIVVDTVEAELAVLLLNVQVAVRLRARVALAVGIGAILLAIAIVVAAVEALRACFGVHAVRTRARVTFAVPVVAVGAAVVVVVDTVEAQMAGLTVDTSIVARAASRAHSRVVEAVLVLAIFVTVPVVVLAVETLATSLRLLAVEFGSDILLAVGVIAVGPAIVIIISAVEAECTVLALLDAAMRAALAICGHALGRAPAASVFVHDVLVLDLGRAPAAAAVALGAGARVRADVLGVGAVQLREDALAGRGVDVAPRRDSALAVEALELDQLLAITTEDGAAAAGEVRQERGRALDRAMARHILAVCVAAARLVDVGKEFGGGGGACIGVVRVSTLVVDASPLLELRVVSTWTSHRIDSAHTLGIAFGRRHHRGVSAVPGDQVHFAGGCAPV